MSDATNDAISIDDLFAALGTTSAPSKGKSGKKSKGKGAAKQPAATAPAASAARPQRAGDASEDDVLNVMAALGISSPKKPQGRTSAPAAPAGSERAQRASQREEQIREQQIRSQQWRRELEEQQKRRRMQIEAQMLAEEEQGSIASQPAAEQQPPRGFAEDQTQIAEPSFLSRRDPAQTAPVAAAQPETVETAPQAPETQLAAAEPVHVAHVAAEGAGAPSSVAAIEQPAAAQAAPVAEAPAADAQPVPAVRTEMPPAEAMDAPFEPDKQVTIPLEDQQPPEPSAAATGTIKPISESSAAAAPVPESAPTQELAEPVPAPSVIKPLDVAPAPAVEEAPRQTAIQPLSEAAMAPAAPLEQHQLERSIVSSDPRPSAQPKKPAPQKKEKKGVNKGNVVGVLLILIALVCAALTVMLLTGTIDATTFSNMASRFGGQQQEELASSSSSSSSAAAEATQDAPATESHAVYQYVVRGTDGSTHRATETATFGTDGLLVQSGIVIDAPDEAQAQALLDQLRTDFGDSVVDSGIRDGEVYLTIDIDRDDLDVDAYTELLSSNMAEFRIVETGANDPA